MSRSFHKFWLKVSAFVVAIAAPIFFLGTMAGTAEPARLTLDILSWPLDGSTTLESGDARFLLALSGGFLLGWGVMIWCLSVWVYDHAPEAVRRTLLIAALCWFALDSTGSITSGNWPNALWNILVLMLVIGPMWVPAREDRVART